MTSPEPPTVIETFVKAAIKGATAIPVVGSGLSAAAQVVYDDVRARRAAVAARTMSEIVAESERLDLADLDIDVEPPARVAVSRLL